MQQALGVYGSSNCAPTAHGSYTSLIRVWGCKPIAVGYPATSGQACALALAHRSGQGCASDTVYLQGGHLDAPRFIWAFEGLLVFLV